MLDRYIQLLKSGKIVAFPTETVYGLGADARNPDAIRKVFEQKGRPADNPLIVHVNSREMVEGFAADIPDEAKKLMDAFWPGPLTLIFKKKPEVLDIITGGLPTVALRWPSHPISQQLIFLAGPLVAPSANTSGRPSPTRPEHVKEDFGDDFPVVEAGETQIGLESTVLDVSEKPFLIYRPGYIGKEEIEDVLQEEIIMAEDSESTEAAKSPGTKYSHYAPKASVQWLRNDSDLEEKSALFLFHDQQQRTAGKNVFYDRDYKQMAHELFDRFRQADHEGFDNIIIEPFTKEQLKQPIVQALRNRVQKAIG